MLIFYDKAKECKDKGKPLLDGFGENVLRYECRWMSRVSRQFGLGQLTASILTNEDFYHSMVKRWGDFYENIHKSFRGDYDMPLMGNVRLANDFIYSILLNLQDAGVVIDIEKIVMSLEKRVGNMITYDGVLLIVGQKLNNMLLMV